MTQKEGFISKEKYSKNLRRIIYETILTSIGPGFSVATITVFWNSIGMDQVAIGFVQMAFTIDYLIFVKYFFINLLYYFFVWQTSENDIFFKKLYLFHFFYAKI